MKLALMLLLATGSFAQTTATPNSDTSWVLPFNRIIKGSAVRTYYPVSIADLAAGRNSHTHIRVTGKVVLVKHEADGDLHIRLSDGKHWIVAECIPELPCSIPKVGQSVTVEGISRFDAKHHWYEVHPVERGVVNLAP